MLRFAAVYGFRNIQTLVRKMKTRRCEYDYVEVMACPSGAEHKTCHNAFPNPSTCIVLSSLSCRNHAWTSNLSLQNERMLGA